MLTLRISLFLAVGTALLLCAPNTVRPGSKTWRNIAWAGQQRSVTLACVGDVLFARGVGKQIAKHGADYPFTRIKRIISSADLAAFNLECTLSKRGIPQRRRMLFRADPATANAARRAGFDIACLANNHTLDYGRDALLDTNKAVLAAGMIPVGAGKSRADAVRAKVVHKNGLRIGFLAYTDLGTCGVVRLDDKPTVPGVRDDTLAGEVRAAKRQCDVLVVFFHWGLEYMKRPTERQRKLARLCVASGANVVFGHHPHVLQTVETYQGNPIVYSSGGFVWDAKIFGADRSAIYVFKLGKSRARLANVIRVSIRSGRPERQ